MSKRLIPLAVWLAGSPGLAQNPAAAPPPAAPMVALPAPPPSHHAGVVVEPDTLLRLMVLNEVSTRSAKPGDRFVLRVDEAVVVNGRTIIPVGAKAWGEVVDADKSGSGGKGGKLNARLLHVEVAGEQIPIVGENKVAGEKGTKQVVMGMLGLGPLALLAPGNNAKLKAGEIFNAYFTTDLLFDPATSRLTALPPGQPAVPEPK